MLGFVHLRVHSAFSLAEGAIKVKDLISLAAEGKMPAVALTDTGNLFGAMEFSLAAAKKGVQPIIGCQMRIAPSPQDPRFSEINNPSPAYEDAIVLLAQSHVGYQNLMKLVSQSYRRVVEEPKDPYITFDELESLNQDLIALTGGMQGPVNKLLLKSQDGGAAKVLRHLHNIFQDRLYIELHRHAALNSRQVEEKLLAFAYDLKIPIVATNDVFFSHASLYEAHDALLCIAAGAYVIQQDRRKVTPQHYFKSSKEMIALFKDLPEAIENTVHIAQRCGFMLEPQKPMLPVFPTPNGEQAELKNQSYEGLQRRLKTQIYSDSMSDEERESCQKLYFQRLDEELSIIIRMGYAGYYLIVADFIQWARRNDIPVGPGRGSGAGSLVAWALTITDIDPIQFNLIFERFLNPERVSMPDFDIDLCQDRRDEVIAYVVQKYGQDRVAQIITFGKLQARAVLRDVGRVLGMPYGQVDKISKLVPSNPANPVTLEQALAGEPQLQQMQKEDPAVARLLDMAQKLEGLYRHASTHAAGVVIGDRPLEEIVALYHDGKSPLAATQFNMKDVETAGLVKFDFLGLKTLTIIQKTITLLKNRDIHIQPSYIPLDDEKTFQLLSRIETIGVFQVESAGMRDVLKRLQPNRFEELIALVALYRPGPMDDIPRYLACKHGQEDVKYLHPDLEEILKETFGVMVYQEQVMKIAQVLGGYSLGAADLLRRAMGKKIKQEMDAQRQIFVEGAQARGLSKEVSSQVFDQMAKFAGYGFNKSHSAPYALIAYQTAYLKANYPVEFMAATMTYDMNNTDKLSIYRQELKRMGISLLSPDVNTSGVEFLVDTDSEGKPAIRYALAAIKNVGAASIELMLTERLEHGPFKDIFDFARRLDSKTVNKRQLEHLISSGAFDSLHSNRAQLYKAIDHILNHVGEVKHNRHSEQSLLFGGEEDNTQMKLPDVSPWSALEQSQKEFDATGFYLSTHPLEAFETPLKTIHYTSANELNDTLTSGPKSLQIIGVIIAKKERIAKSGQKYAFVQFSDPTGVFEVTFFSELYHQWRDQLVLGKSFILKVLARLEEDVVRIQVQEAHLLGDIMRGMRACHIYIEESHEKELFQRIKHILERRAAGSDSVHLLFQDGEKKIKLSLSDRYQVDEEIHARLLKVQGVSRVTYH